MNQQWQAAFGQMTYGIYVLTTVMDDTVNGMIASWVSQVSYDPPLIMAAVHPNRYSHDMIVNSRAFGLHIIDQSQKALLGRFKGPDPGEKFSGMDWKPGKTGVPILKDCLAWFELQMIHHHQPGNHSLFIGTVVDADVQSQGSPLSTQDYEGMYVGKS
ncbi:MAG: flavin reductase family protein [Desulfotignum sp.]|jgi:flavin reductase (DIM6/NTAB) family NADH-FMN oxidoreductase RutF|nr:flavin reductase family protein [Desulfotignum sp.]